MFESSALRFGFIIGVALAAHLTTVLVRATSRRLLRSRMRSEAKLLTVSGFVTSLMVFTIYFAAFGFVLTELGVSLTTYLASASVIGLAVSFGSQGIVQDAITGLTVVFSDLIDVGDMVDIGGQVGIVERVGMRFTVLVNFTGARVYVPNRSIGNVTNYPYGYTRAFMDIRLPEGEEDRAEQDLAELAQSAWEQYPGILLLPPKVMGRSTTRAGHSYVRIKFRIWPGQGALLEGPIAASMVTRMKSYESEYMPALVSVHYRAETAGADSSKRLPRPAALPDPETASRREA